MVCCPTFQSQNSTWTTVDTVLTVSVVVLTISLIALSIISIFPMSYTQSMACLYADYALGGLSLILLLVSGAVKIARLHSTAQSE